MTALVFDLDGTLVDSAPDLQAAVNLMLEEERLEPLGLATVTGFIGHGLPILVDRVMQARGMDRDRFGQVLARVNEIYAHSATERTVAYPNVEATLKQLHGLGFGLGVCSNKPLALAQRVLDGVGIGRFFGAVIGGDSLPVKKPDPAPLRAAFEALGARQGLFVGDSEVDAQTAINASTGFALHSEGYRKAEIAAIPHDYKFADFRALPGIAETAIAG